LASPARAGGIGKVYLDFQPALPSLPDDPAIDFFISPGRFGWFSVLPGEEATWFGPRQDIWFQTGTTAGRITVTVSLGEHREQAVLDIPPAPVVITSLTAKRANSGLEVSLWGIDNTRTGSQIVFSFFDAAGQLVAPGHISLNAAGAFRNYYESSVLGGTFALRAAFPVTGDASVLAGAEVEITNAAGVTRSERVPITP